MKFLFFKNGKEEKNCLTTREEGDFIPTLDAKQQERLLSENCLCHTSWKSTACMLGSASWECPYPRRSPELQGAKHSFGPPEGYNAPGGVLCTEQLAITSSR